MTDKKKFPKAITRHAPGYAGHVKIFKNHLILQSNQNQMICTVIGVWLKIMPVNLHETQ